MSGWGQNQGGWGQQPSNQGGWGGQQQQGGWGQQQQPSNQGGWGGQQQQGGWGGQQQQGGWGQQQPSNQGWGGNQQTNQGWGGQQQNQYGGQYGQQPSNQWGGQQNTGGFTGGIIGGATNLFNRFTNRTKPNKLSRAYYSIVSEKANGRVFDICQSDSMDSSKIGTLIIWEGYGGPNQSFGIVQENGKYLFKCKQPNGYLTVQGPQDGARFFISPNKIDRSYFDFQPVGDKKYFITTCYGKAMDIQNDQKTDGTSVIQWPIKNHDRDNQIWTLQNPKEITSSSSERY